MNITKAERRVLDMLSLGGRIIVEKDQRNKPLEVDFMTREGWFLDAAGLQEFQSLRAKRLIFSKDGCGYRITRDGILSLQKLRQSSRENKKKSLQKKR